MTCEELRVRLEAGDESVDMHRHLRRCADCLELAVSREPANLFVTLGRGDLLPAGGTEEFVAAVMHEVRLRETEKSIQPAEHPLRVAWWWSAAAAIFILMTTWLAIQPRLGPESDGRTSVPAVTAVEQPAPPLDSPTITLPVVAEYDQPNATIVELPTESDDDLKIVMIFDESLPQDL